MPVFLRFAAVGSAAFLVVELIPLAWFNFVLCWAIVIGAAYQYPHLILSKVQAMSSSVGFAVGMGAALGAIINFCGMLGALILHSIVFALAAHGMNVAHPTDADEVGSLAGSMGVAGDFLQLLGAPVWGAVLGAVGGLVGGSTIPKPAARGVAQP
jgi:hypothetical protein